MDPWSSYSLYGGTPPAQPTPTGTADHPPGTPEPTVRTLPRPGGLSLQHNPTLLLVGMLGLAAVLVMRIHGHFD
jgi:hypothetical protein